METLSVKPDPCEKQPRDSGDTPGLTVCALASGSRGNAIFVSDGTTAILIDAGLSGVEIERRMAHHGLLSADLDAIVVTHEHNDHIQGVGVLARRFHLPVFMTRQTHRATPPQLGKIEDLHRIACGTPFAVGTLDLHPFAISHDAADPCGFTIARNGIKVGVATDLGIATAMVREHLRDCQGLIIEANHDPEMLLNGPYPWPLKQRIRSRTGHLSNPETRDLLETLVHDSLQHVVLAHLSESNNTPEKAEKTVARVLAGSPVRLSVACQDRCGDLLKFP
ncbi:MAG: MBL fold metallo-hydrolase [Desulfobacterales bacterium]|nr:MBL fold metallo-hydrolase [Desulfobacterales bacterium]